jgi:hypothetical protein
MEGDWKRPYVYEELKRARTKKDAIALAVKIADYLDDEYHYHAFIRYVTNKALK